MGQQIDDTLNDIVYNHQHTSRGNTGDKETLVTGQIRFEGPKNGVKNYTSIYYRVVIEHVLIL